MKWQPIASAPRGVNFVGGCYHRIYGWIWGRCRWCWNDNFDPSKGGYVAGDVNATHWAELPAPPEEEEP